MFFLGLFACLLALLLGSGALAPPLAAWLLAGAGLAATYIAILRGWLGFSGLHDELHLVNTQDGWQLPVYRFRPSGPAKDAVLLLHGIYSTMHLFDAGGDQDSLALYLRERGFDVYCLELRAMGRFGTLPRRFGRHRHAATYDDYVQFDLPAAVEHVRRVSGCRQLCFVGHSMGGMIFYPFGATPLGAESIRRAVTLGAIGGLPKRRFWHAFPMGWLRLLPRLPASEASAFLLAPLVGLVPWLERRFLEPRHLDRHLRRRYFFNGVANSPLTLIHHFADMLRRGQLASRNGEVDYRALCCVNRVPTLVVAGAADQIAPPALVHQGYELLAGEKAYLEAGRASGAEHDFGHADLAIGHGARLHVWPRLVDWLREAPGSTETGPETPRGNPAP